MVKPRTDGRIRMPAVAPGMNKISPAFKMDDKGSVLGAPKADKERKQKILERGRKRMERVISAESDNRKAALEDRKFKKGDQWPSEVIAQRNLDKRPWLTINKLPTFVHQITNEQRQNRLSISVNPVGDRGDRKVAWFYRGLIRQIERSCSADIAYDTAFDDAATSGWGYWRVLTEWEAPDSFNLVLTVARIRNPFSVYLDPSHQDPTGADAKWGFVTEMMPREEFEAKYPDADPMPYTDGGIGESYKSWNNKDEVRIAEYFEIEYKTRTLVALDTGHVGWKDELDDLVLRKIKAGAVQILDERESRVPKVMWYKMSAKDILMEREWPGSTLPIVKVIGEELDVEGKVYYSGVIRNAKDAQRMYNYWSTSETEMVALAPKAPFIGEEGQFEGHEDEWKMANIRSMPYLSYKGTSVGGHPIPPPQRQPFSGAPGGIIQAKMGAAQDLMATTGVRFDGTMNERLMDESGKAIHELRRTGDIGSFHYVDNLARALRRTGEIFIELIPLIYSDKRVITILREDDKEEQVAIDPSLPQGAAEMRQQNGKTLQVFNPSYGKYGVAVTIGPSYATKRIEASQNMIAFARALPQTAALIADLIAKNQDWPGAEEIAARLAKTLPPNLLQPDMKDVPPQIQAVLQAQDGQIKQLGAQLQQTMLALNDKNADRAVLMEQIAREFEAKLLKIAADTETKLAAIQQKADLHEQTKVGDNVQALGENVAQLIETLDQAAGGQPPAANDQGNPQQAGQQQAQGGAPGAPQAQNDNTLPPEAARHLREGRVTTFGNGTKWTLKNGQPLRVA